MEQKLKKLLKSYTNEIKMERKDSRYYIFTKLCFDISYKVEEDMYYNFQSGNGVIANVWNSVKADRLRRKIQNEYWWYDKMNHNSALYVPILDVILIVSCGNHSITVGQKKISDLINWRIHIVCYNIHKG